MRRRCPGDGAPPSVATNTEPLVRGDMNKMTRLQKVRSYPQAFNGLASGEQPFFNAAIRGPCVRGPEGERWIGEPPGPETSIVALNVDVSPVIGGRGK